MIDNYPSGITNVFVGIKKSNYSRLSSILFYFHDKGFLSEIDYIDKCDHMWINGMIERICINYDHNANGNTKALEIILSNEPAFRFRGICSKCGFSQNKENDKLNTDLIYELMDVVVYASLLSPYNTEYNNETHNAIISKIDSEFENILKLHVFNNEDFKWYFLNNREIIDLEDILLSKLEDLPDTTFVGVCPNCRNSFFYKHKDKSLSFEDVSSLNEMYDHEVDQDDDY